MLEALNKTLEHAEYSVTESPLLGGIIDESGFAYGKYSTAQLEALEQNAVKRQPELARWLQIHQTDGLHASQSGSLRSILERGILPQKDLGQVPFPVTSVEFRTLPEPRPRVHMVHWLFAQEITPYAENSEHHITPENYQDAIYPDELIAKWEGANSMPLTHLRNRHFTAVALRDYLQSSDADQAHVDMLSKSFPVVFGICSRQLSKDDISPVQSAIKGDVAYEGHVEPSAITGIFVPRIEIERAQKISDKPVFALEDLRTMTNNLA